MKMKVLIVLFAVAVYCEAAGIKCIQGKDESAAPSACSNTEETYCSQPKFVEYTGMSRDVEYKCGKCTSETKDKTCVDCRGDSCNKPKETGADFMCKNWEFKSDSAAGWSVAATSTTCKRLKDTKIMCNMPGTKADKDTKVANAGCGPCGEDDKKNNLCADCDKAECNTAKMDDNKDDNEYKPSKAGTLPKISALVLAFLLALLY